MPRTATPDGPGERVALLSRTTIELRKQLEVAASMSGRSLGQEVERRLEHTFDFDYLLGDNETALVLRSIANAIRRFEMASGKSWVKDSETQARVHEAVSKMVDVLLEVRPQGDDRREAISPGLPIDWNDPEMRTGLRTMALDAAIHDLQIYRKLKEQELISLRGEGQAYREARRAEAEAQSTASNTPLPELPHEARATRKREAVTKANKENLAALTAALNNRTPGAAFEIRGAAVREQGADGVWREVPPAPTDGPADPTREVMDAIEQALDLVQVEPSADGSHLDVAPSQKRRTRTPT